VPGEQAEFLPVASGGAMTDTIKTGTILIEEGTPVPDSLLLESEPYSSGWGSLRNLDLRGLDRNLAESGWTFFYMAGEIRATAAGLDRRRAVREAVKRIIANVKSQKCNCLEISQVAMKSFLRVPYVTVSAHARHIQEGLVFSGTAARSNRSTTGGRPRQRRLGTEIIERPLFTEEAINAWEGEGGAPGAPIIVSGIVRHDDSKTGPDENFEFVEVVL